jgi:MraZ protein
VFFGEHDHSLDDKGRITVPASFREHLAGGAFVIRGPQCLVVFPRETFEATIAPKLRRNPVSSDVPRIVNSGSAIEMDKAGRMLLPPPLRRWAGIEPGDAAVIVGNDRHMEIWSRSAWDLFIAESMTSDSIVSGLREIGL